MRGLLCRCRAATSRHAWVSCARSDRRAGCRGCLRRAGRAGLRLWSSRRSPLIEARDHSVIGPRCCV
ncbi:MAG: hypothetical protein OJF58_000017 [Enhydrobacter sp.]|nr:MAG: hypothetical protein OJF58_000017 [Enhydrobacter sp.]